jgi:hypothetical protein
LPAAGGAVSRPARWAFNAASGTHCLK